MTAEDFFTQAFVYLAAAVATVPVARRLGLGSVLGYLIAGAIIGPFGLRLVADEGQNVMHFAEFGVVMMLFLIGLELQPSLLWRLRSPILGFGGLQVLVTSVVIAAGAMLFGQLWQSAIAVGLTLSLSSTAIVLQSLGEKGLRRTSGGESAFAVLLFQDIAVIPMLALFPLLASTDAVATTHSSADAASGIATLPAWAQALAVLAAVGGVVAVGRYLVRPVFRSIAKARLQEMFTAASLLFVIGVAMVMSRVGLSPALGTFLAGVVLADSEYRHELEADLEPFKGLLLGLFFVSVGASIDFGAILSQPLVIAVLLGAVLLVKGGVLIGLARLFGLASDQGLLVALALPQVGEFAFVLLAFATQLGLLSAALIGQLIAIVALSMAVTPLLLLAYERIVASRLRIQERPSRESDVVDEQAAVLIAGFGGFGSMVGRLLTAHGIRTTVLDVDSDRVELLRRIGLKVYFGDATRPDLLRVAGADTAHLVVLALDSAEATLSLVHGIRRHYPHLQILARAFDWDDAHALLEAGAHRVYRQQLDTPLRAGAEAMHLLGFRAHQAHRAAQKFLRHDEDMARELTAHRGDRDRYLNVARERIETLERIMLADLREPGLDRDVGWDAGTQREAALEADATGPHEHPG